MVADMLKFLCGFAIFLIVFFGLATCASNAELKECNERAKHLHTEVSYYQGKCYLKGFGVSP